MAVFPGQDPLQQVRARAPAGVPALPLSPAEAILGILPRGRPPPD